MDSITDHSAITSPPPPQPATTAVPATGAEHEPPGGRDLPGTSGPARSRRRGPIVGALAAVAGLALGAGIATVVAGSTADDLRRERDDVRSQLESTSVELDAAQTEAATATTATAACQQLAGDSAAMVEQVNQLEAIWARIDTGEVVFDSPEDLALGLEMFQIRLEMQRLQGAITADMAVCQPAPETT